MYFQLSIYAKLLVLWSVLQHELYAELKSYGQLYMYGRRCNFLVCPKLVLLWSVSTWIYSKLKIHAKLKFYGQLTLKPMLNSKFMLNLLHIYGMMHCTQRTGTGGSNLWYKMADQGGNVRQALVDIARQATCLLQRYENSDVNTIENDIINPLENLRTAGTSAAATSSRARVSCYVYGLLYLIWLNMCFRIQCHLHEAVVD